MSKTSNIRLSTILTPRWNTFCIYHIWNARSEKKTARCWNVCLHVEDIQYPVEHHINATKMKYNLYISQVVFNIWNARSEKKATRCWNVCLHVEDVEYPVEHHVNTKMKYILYISQVVFNILKWEESYEMLKCVLTCRRRRVSSWAPCRHRTARWRGRGVPQQPSQTSSSRSWLSRWRPWFCRSCPGGHDDQMHQLLLS